MNLAGHSERYAIEQPVAGDEERRTVGALPEKWLRQYVDRGEDGGGINVVHAAGAGRIQQYEPPDRTPGRDHLGDESSHGMAGEHRRRIEILFLDEPIHRIG